MNIQEMTIVELKALAYDQLVIIENTQKNLQAINAVLAEKNKPVENPEVPATPEVKESV
jgi:hypothetical protein